MKRLNKKRTSIIIISLVIIFLLLRIQVSLAHPDYYLDDYCKEGHGKDWFYLKTNVFGDSCAQPSTELYKKLRIIPIDFQEADEYCEKPGFWDLTRWGYDCD